MVTKKTILGSELVKEIISIRVDTLWKMLSQIRDGTFPDTHEEGATGKFDNKGAIFIPGGVVYQDVDEMPIRYTKRSGMTPETFRQKIREAMQYDNATLLFPDGIVTGINLDSGFFSKAARDIFTYKRAAFRRKTKIESHKHLKVSATDIIRSHCPTYLSLPYGARTRISTCASVGLIDPPLFFSYCETHFNLSKNQAERFAKQLDTAQDAAKTDDGIILYPPYIIVCHDTRYKTNSLTGLTRILGVGKFGEFATVSFERVDHMLTGELKRKHQTFTTEDLFATYHDVAILCILRIYAPTNPGKRSQRYTLHVISPEKDMELDLDQIKQEAQERYHVQTN